MWASQVFGATYYIDPTCTSSGDGTTTTCGTHGPFKTWAEVSWAAGNTYLQKGGTTAREEITVGASGRAGNLVTIGSYGTGKAIIDGAVPISSWTANDPVAGVYSTPAVTNSGILEDGKFLKCASDTSCRGGNWFWISGIKNYYKPTSGTPANHTVEYMRNAGIQLGDHHYITIDGLAFTKCRCGVTSSASDGSTNSYITITNCEFYNMPWGIVIFMGDLDGTSTNITITHNTFAYINNSIELGASGCVTGNSPNNFSSVEIAYNTITYGSQVYGADYVWHDRVGYYMWDDEGIGTQNIVNSSIHHNTISGHCNGIVHFVCTGDSAYNNDIYNNYVDVDGAALYMRPGTRSENAKAFYNNRIYYNVAIGRGDISLVAAGCAVGLFNVDSPVPIHNYFYNNTIIAKYVGIYGVGADYYTIKNNIFYALDLMGYGRYHIALPDSWSSIFVDYNLYYPGSNTFINPWAAQGRQKTWAEWKA